MFLSPPTATAFGGFLKINPKRSADRQSEYLFLTDVQANTTPYTPIHTQKHSFYLTDTGTPHRQVYNRLVEGLNARFPYPFTTPLNNPTFFRHLENLQRLFVALDTFPQNALVNGLDPIIRTTTTETPEFSSESLLTRLRQIDSSPPMADALQALQQRRNAAILMTLVESLNGLRGVPASKPTSPTQSVPPSVPWYKAWWEALQSISN